MPQPSPPQPLPDDDEVLDEADEESFPASDPPSGPLHVGPPPKPPQNSR